MKLIIFRGAILNPPEELSATLARHASSKDFSIFTLLQGLNWASGRSWKTRGKKGLGKKVLLKGKFITTAKKKFSFRSLFPDCVFHFAHTTRALVVEAQKIWVGFINDGGFWNKANLSLNLKVLRNIWKQPFEKNNV